MNIGQRIKQFRLNQGMTQEQFGKLFGVSKAVVNNWEHTRNYPNKNNLKKIADYMGTTPEVLMLNTFECEIWAVFDKGQLKRKRLLGAFRSRYDAIMFLEFLKEKNFYKDAESFEFRKV